MPKTNADMARELARLSSDCSFLLTHLVRQNDDRSDIQAKNILLSILDMNRRVPKPRLNASSVGWYSRINPNLFEPETGEFDGLANSHAVCFTESTLAGLKAHRDVFSARYGLSFDRDYLFESGANPCLNISKSLLYERVIYVGERYDRRVYNFIPYQLQPYVNIINESFDATHEREWRYPGDFSFKYEDILFIFCPQKDFSIFCSIQSCGRPVLFDLAWLDRV